MTQFNPTDKDALKQAAKIEREKRMTELREKQLLAAQQMAINLINSPTPAVQTNSISVDTKIPTKQTLKEESIKPLAALTIEQLQIELYNRKKDLLQKADSVVLDADAYRVNIPTIKLLTEDKTPEERMKYIGNIAVITGVPIIVVVVYIEEIYGTTSELQSKKKSLMEFYTVSEILNVRSKI